LTHDYNEETGEVEKNPSTGLPLERKSEFAPCRLFAAGKRQHLGPCPKGTPEDPKSLLPQNEACYRHYQECQAVGEFPDDPLVRRHARLIREIEQGYERYRDELKHTRLLAAIVGVK
jgi:hypothetical protein